MPEKLPHPECARLTREMDARRDRETRKGPDGKTPYWRWYYENVQKPKRKKAKEAGK